jgi:hypothetical protein
VEFENWSSLTYTVNKPTPLDLSNGGGDPQRDVNRTFEITGVAGGRRVFHYYADTVDKVLYLEDKYKAIPDRRNKAAGVGGDGGTETNQGRSHRKKGDRRSDDKSDGDKNQSDGDKKNNPEYEAGVEKTAKAHTAEDWIPKEARAHIGNEVNQIDKRASSSRRDRDYAEAATKKEKRNRMILKYDTIDGSHVILTGINENKDSVYIVLDKINKTLALTRSSLQAGNY